MSYEGFDFYNFKDFRVYSQRKALAPSLYSNLLHLGISDVVAYDVVCWFIAGFVANTDIIPLCRVRDKFLRDYGTMYPDNLEPSDFVFTEESANYLRVAYTGQPVQISVYDFKDDLPECLFGEYSPKGLRD